MSRKSSWNLKPRGGIPVNSSLRSLYKAVTWRVFGTATTAIIVYMLTRKWSLALYAGSLELISKIAIYWVHERLWELIPVGKKKA